MNKRGISPIIATLLLISFAVAIGVVIMNFGRAQVELEAQCAIDAGMKLANIGGEKEICYDAGSKTVKFTIENGVNIKVEGLIFNVIGTEKAETYELNNAQMGKAGNYLGSVSYDSSVSGEIRQIKISPKVILFDEEQICVEKALIVESVKKC
jgi:flagellin-like protein